MPYVAIDDLHDDRVAIYRELPRRNLTRTSGRFIAESRLLVERLLASSLVTESILCSERYRDELQHLADSAIPIYVVPHGLLSEIIGFHFHRGMLACGLRPSNPTLTQIAGRPHNVDFSEDKRLLVVCPQILDPTNLAGVIRNCSAFGVDGLLLGPHCADPFSRRVVRVSMGTVFQLRVRTANDLSADLRSLHDEHFYHRVATVLDHFATPLPSAHRPPRLSLMFGSEARGLDDEWIKLSDEQITLTMELGTDSLNVATATGVFLYHFTQVAKQ
jgi:tRNA G18 (ribose-2'-O)-methylase SpoU